MATEQNFPGNYTSTANQVIGSQFHGPVVFNTPEFSRRLHLKPMQSNAKSDSLGRPHDIGSEISGSGLNEGFNWDGERHCVRSLSFEESNDRELVIETQSAGTCEWLLKSQDYLSWSEKHGLLLVRVRIGPKREIASPSEAIVLSFFFSASGTDLQKSTLGFFRSLMLQLLQNDDDSKSAFLKNYGKTFKPQNKKNSTLKWYPAGLEAEFHKLIIDCCARRKVLIFVDALDECKDEDRNHVISFLHSLRSQSGERLNRPGIFITCRPHPDGQIMEDFNIRLEKESQDDIQSYIEQELRLPVDTAKEVDDFKRTLVREANGLFLWLVLIIPQIHEMSAKGLSLTRISSEILESSRELDDLYDGLLKRIEDSELLEAIALFHLICYAGRPLTLDELRIAFTMHLSGSKQSLKEYEDGKNPHFVTNQKQMTKRMVYLSRGLIDTTSAKATKGETVVGFHHDTIRGFMLKKGLKGLSKRLYGHHNIPNSANVQLANTCLLYLSTNEIRASCLEKALTKRFPFIGYAVTYWLPHAVSAEREGLGEDILWPTDIIFEVWVKICKGLGDTSIQSARENTTLMHIAAEYDLQTLAERILRSNDEQKPVNISGRHSRVLSGLLSTLLIKAGGRIHSGRIGDGHKVCEMLKEGNETGKKVFVKMLNVNGELPIHLAAKHGSLAMIEFLYKARRGFKGLDDDQRKALYVGSQHGTDDDIHVTTKDGWTPLFAASTNGHLEVVKFLYEHGADADIHVAAKDGWTALSVASSNGHLEVVEFLYEHGADADIHVATKNGWTPLSAASDSGHLEVVKFLYEHGADADIHTAAKNGWTPLSAASSNGHLEVVRFLYEHGADADIHVATKDGWTPFSVASSNGHLEVVEFLYEHGADADIHVAAKDGWTALSVASSNGHLEVVEFLYEHGADADIHVAAINGWTPLSAASSNGHLEVVRFLYEHGADADIHIATKNGQTPLSAASDSGHLEMLKFLYEHGADADIHTAAKNGQTPLSAASSNGRLDVVKFLYEHGADADIHTVTKNNQTPLYASSSNGHLEVVKFLYQHGADADIHTATINGWTPLSAASSNGHLEVVKFLYEHGADTDVHSVANNGQTPLYASSSNGHLEVVKCLYGHGADADIHSVAKNSQTPLYTSSSNGHLEVVKFLYEHRADADIHITTNDGWTPLSAASSNGHLEILNFLYEHGADADFYAASLHLEVVKFLFEHEADANIHTAMDG
ncbi:hypothetical protein N7490_001806 [Penicillium lividum]|nr:hypothetical protein N7490_001806 [Penicillium lividum]